MVSLKLRLIEDIIEKINENLPPQIRVLGKTVVLEIRGTGKFAGEQDCLTFSLFSLSDTQELTGHIGPYPSCYCSCY